MILIKFIFGYFALFVLPTLVIYFKYKNLKSSLVFSYGLITSFTISWIIFLISYSLKIDGIYLLGFLFIASVFSLIYIYKKGNNQSISDSSSGKLNIYIWILIIVTLFPLFRTIGDVFMGWDAVVSWNRWGIELSQNKYYPQNTAYPILVTCYLESSIQNTRNIRNLVDCENYFIGNPYIPTSYTV